MSQASREQIARRIEADRTIDLERYREDGAESRTDYLCDLAEIHGLSVGLVFDMAELLGPDEDFDGLVNACEDAERGIGMGGARV